LWRTVSHETDFTLEQGKSVRIPPPEEEGVAETVCDELTTSPIPCPPVPLRERTQQNENDVKPRKKGEMRGKCFNIVLFLTFLL